MVPLRFTTGEEGHAVALEGDVLEAHVAGSHPVGQPVQFELSLADGTLTLEAKSRGSKRLEDGRFAAKLRLVALRKNDRARLVSALS